MLCLRNATETLSAEKWLVTGVLRSPDGIKSTIQSSSPQNSSDDMLELTKLQTWDVCDLAYRLGMSAIWPMRSGQLRSGPWDVCDLARSGPLGCLRSCP